MLDLLRNGGAVSAFGMQKSNRFWTAALAADSGGPMVYVCPDLIAAREAAEYFRCLEAKTFLLPAKDDVLPYRKGRSGENAAVRLGTLGAIATGAARLVVTSADALTQLFPPRATFAAACIRIEKGGSYDVYDLIDRLTQAGRRR